MSEAARVLRYRPEIDGLRCLAVVPVVLYHAGFGGFRGGFLGVDVFFVISGYLIGGIVFGELADGSFTFARFYERRARRILPALFCVLALSAIAGWFVLVPARFEELGNSLLAVGLFGSNFLFWRETGYFAADADLNPLLHTWSLGVEEQFYFVFPLLLATLVRRARGAVVPVLALLAAASLALAEQTAMVEPSAAFFLPHTRLWELFAGVLLAVTRGAGEGVDRRLREGLAAAGAVACLLSFVLVPDAVQRSALHLLAPVVGTGLLVSCADSTTVTGRVLSWRPLVLTGLISYSLYLYHQPVFAMVRILVGRPLAPWALLAPAGFSYALAYATWRWVERPFRDRQRIPREWLTPMAVALLLLPVCGGAVIRVQRGFPARLSSDVNSVLARMSAGGKERMAGIRWGECAYNSRKVEIDQFIRRWRCLSEPGGGGLLVFGDSHAADRAWALRAAGLPVGVLAGAGCPLYPDPGRDECTVLMTLARNLARSGKVRGLLLVQRWSREEVGGSELRAVGEFWRRAGTPVLLFGPMPEHPFVEDLVPRYARAGRSLAEIPIDSALLAATGPPVERLAREFGFTYLDTRDAFCGGHDGSCSAFDAGRPLVADDHGHLSGAGAERLGASILASPAWRRWTASLAAP